ncbi:hypothetical protein KC340_g10713 [Hortaea werneckii]|nr:hypothetical protein KC342_g2905 [Hortaea werneckii]KAI7103721.1 hypothetical protein KC339_g5042 [Hortaea werneckii]KAI7227018.1 hypothetical protein KC365_g9118 [Hortaea werneckii]KAI7309573.1 hypothetical protein KC340_g10713 [Hortaea werneckii]KAI7389829.1 hypothetical protein KC328_g8250 [Hortaea werneckii]
MQGHNAFDEDYDISDGEPSLINHEESLADVESNYAEAPSDGYFAHREHPGETFVEQSPAHTESEAKAKETRPDPPNLFHSSSQADSLSTRTRPPAWTDETTPILDAGPAPPDYAAATANRLERSSRQRPAPQRSAEQAVTSRSYGSFESNGSSQSQHQTSEQNELHWPLGNRGNPFDHSQWRFGRNGNPFANSNSASGANDGLLASQGLRQSMQDSRQRSGSANSSLSDRTVEDGLLRPRQEGPARAGRPRRRKCGCCRPAALLNLVFIIMIVGLVVLIVRLIRDASISDVPADKGRHGSTPEKSRDGNANAGGPDDPFRSNTTMPGHPTSGACTFNYYSDSISFEFAELDDFALVELLEPTFNELGAITGNIWVMSAPPEQEVDVKVWVSFATTAPWQVTDASYGYSKSGLELRFPDLEKTPRRYAGAPCMDVGIIVYVSHCVELKEWHISTANLDVKVEEGIFEKDSLGRRTFNPNMTSIIAIRGNVEVAYWSSRHTIIDVPTGSVHGTYALRDVLSVHTHSGSISITVDPQEADEKYPAPAEFEAVSHSGGVHVDFLDYSLPDREYKTRVESHSGSISGSYVHGSKTAMHTDSGAIDVEIKPYCEKGPSGIYTDSGNGSSRLVVGSPYCDPDSAISDLHSQHRAKSGSMELIYPRQWEGIVEGWSYSGSITLKGRDLEPYSRQGVSPIGKHVIARKGHGDSQLSFRTTSGSAKVNIGAV